MTDDHDPLSAEHGALFLARQRRLRQVMHEQGVPVLLVVDPIQIRYATGSRNMQVFGSRDASRYLLLFAEGPALLFEYPGCVHISRHLPTLDEVREAQGIPYVGLGSDTSAPARRWAAGIGALVREHAGPGAVLAVDRLHFAVIDALRAEGFRLVDAEVLLGAARTIKQPEELPFIRRSVQVVEQAVQRMAQNLRPGMSENEAWSHFHAGLIEGDGEYVSTRLFAGGARTFPYFREAGPHPLAAGDLLAFDTDAIGVDGYAVDFSRTFLVGEVPATDAQRRLFALAREQLEWNVECFVPGRSFREIAERAWQVPAAYRRHSYYVIAHGIGMSGEFPAVPHLFDADVRVPDGVLQPGMTVCVESYVGSAAEGAGVKLEQHLLIGEHAPEVLSRLPFDDALGPRHA